MDDGILPVSWLCLKIKSFMLNRLPIWKGISIDKEFLGKNNLFNSFKYEIEDGISPKKLFLLRDNSYNFVIFPISLEIFPPREL